jgi:signal transduction histidine kinase
VYVILFLSVSLLLLAIAFTFRTFNDTGQNFSRIERADSIISRVSAFESYILMMGPKVNLAMNTHNMNEPDMKLCYADGKEQLETIESLIRDPSELTSVDTLKALLDDKFVIWNGLLQISSDSSTEKNLAINLRMHSSLVTSHIGTLTESLRSNEKTRLREGIKSTKQGIAIISTVLTGAALFSLVCIFFAFTRLHVEIKREMLVQLKLQHKIRELDRSNAHLERFAYTASHDLQEPLRKLHAFSEKLVLQEKDKLSDEGQDIIDRMQKFVHRMQRLIDDLLLFSRTINYKLVKAPVDLNRVLIEVKQNISENIMASGAIINSAPLPQIMGFESQLQQLFQNLISNSIRYAKKDVSPVIVITASVVTGDKIIGVRPGDENKKFNMLAFADNGIGFDNKYADRIFEIFQRLHGKSEYEGTGIGLSICKLVAENHEGYIKASGVESVGTNFLVYFPAI